MPLSTAHWLATECGYDRFGTPSADQLLDAGMALYFAAAYIEHLAQYDGEPRCESFIVRAFHFGPKAGEHASGAELDVDALLADAEGAAPQHGAALRAALLLRAYGKAQRHLAELAALERQHEGFQPMHVVVAGDTLSSIARACKTSKSVICALNPDLPVQLKRGDCIAVPNISPPHLYLTRAGDTWATVAAHFRGSASRLRAQNADVLMMQPSDCRMYSREDTRVLLPGQLVQGMGLHGNNSFDSEASVEDPAGFAWTHPLASLTSPRAMPRYLVRP